MTLTTRYLLTRCVVVIGVTLLLGRQTVPPGGPTDSFHPLLVLLFRCAVLLFMLRGHDVTSSQADVVQDGTGCDDLKVSKIIL